MNQLFYNIIKAINEAANWNFIIVARTQSGTRQCLYATIFFASQLWKNWKELRESLLKSLKITLKKFVKFMIRFRKTINSPKNSFWKK